MIALLIGYESLSRFFNPVPIAFNQAIPIAVVGLGINLLSALLLREDHDHHHHPDPHHERDQAHTHSTSALHHRDHNLRAAFVHVLADAAVSVLVIIRRGIKLWNQCSICADCLIVALPPAVRAAAT